MYFQIKSVVLWPKNQTLDPRIVEFELNCVNVIYGRSKTGKSSIIPIIDYCLGADKCKIPVGKIRQSCEWFGIVVALNNRELLIARRESGKNKTTDQMYLLSEDSVVIPHSIPGANANRRNIKEYLSEVVGLISINPAESDNSGSTGFGRPSFRDLVPMVFQPQNIVANPNTLFYKADSYEHRNKLRNMFPLILGAIQPRALIARIVLADLRKQLARRERELRALSNVSERWRGEAKAWILRAIDLGLISAVASIDDMSWEECLHMLSTIISTDISDTIPEPSTSGITKVVDSIEELRKEETQIALRLGVARNRFRDIQDLNNTTHDFRGALAKQHERLSLSSWLLKKAVNDTQCPICSQALDKPNEELTALCQALEQVEVEAGQTGPLSDTLARQEAELRVDINHFTEQLITIRRQIKMLEDEEETEKPRRYKNVEVYRLIGRIEQAVSIFRESTSDTGLEEAIADLKRQISELEQTISESNIRQRVERTLDRFSTIMARALHSLDSERKESRVILSIPDLTLKFSGETGWDYLWEIGSGANWVAFHIATMVSLHTIFVNNDIQGNRSSVPGFLIFDQPSQAYFPRASVAEDGSLITELIDDDLRAVGNIFRFLSSFTEWAKTKSGVQVIVLEHANVTIWDEVDGIHQVEVWGEGEGESKLIPPEWDSLLHGTANSG